MERTQRYLDNLNLRIQEEDRPFLVSSEAPSQTIFEYYAVENDIAQIRELQGEYSGSAEEDIVLYLENQIRFFLGEFVFRLPKDKVVYLLREDGKFYAKGVLYPVERSFLRATEVKDEGLRVRSEAEYEGFLKVQQAFNEGANLVFWLSPPSFGVGGFGNYSFVFVLVKEGDVVIEHIIRLDNEDRNFSKVRQALFEVLTEALQPYQQAKVEFPDDFGGQKETSFLSTPVIMQVEDPKAFLERVSFTRNLDELPVEARLLEEFVAEDRLFTAFFEEYKSAVKKGDIEAAKRALNAIYNRAQEFLKEKEEGVIVKAEFYPEDELQILLNYYASQAAWVPAGSCPVDTAGRVVNVTKVQALMQRFGGRVDYFAADVLTRVGETVMKCVTCPECKQVVDAIVKDNKIICPECGATKTLH